jgi:hypothetical protein
MHGRRCRSRFDRDRVAPSPFLAVHRRSLVRSRIRDAPGNLPAGRAVRFNGPGNPIGRRARPVRTAALCVLAPIASTSVGEELSRDELKSRAAKAKEEAKAHEGAATFPDGVYRAEELCHMQRGKGKEYRRVCTEASELGLYRFFPPIESVAPVMTLQRLSLTGSLEFVAIPVVPARVSWFVDGRRLDSKPPKITRRSRKTRARGGTG